MIIKGNYNLKTIEILGQAGMDGFYQPSNIKALTGPSPGTILTVYIIYLYCTFAPE